METKMKKQSMGRQKIEMKKIEKKSNLQVTFSKRRSGLFKKVAEFTTLNGVAAAVLVESPGGKLFAFGNPSVEHVIDKYHGLNKDDHVVSTDVNKYEEVVKKVKDDQELHGNELFWWRKGIDHMGLHELEEYRDALMELKSNVMGRVNQMRMEIPVLGNNGYEGICSSSMSSGGFSNLLV